MPGVKYLPLSIGIWARLLYSTRSTFSLSTCESRHQLHVVAKPTHVCTTCLKHNAYVQCPVATHCWLTTQPGETVHLQPDTVSESEKWEERLCLSAAVDGDKHLRQIFFFTKDRRGNFRIDIDLIQIPYCGGDSALSPHSGNGAVFCPVCSQALEGQSV